MFVFDAAATWVACELSIPAAVRFVKTSKHAKADARAILKAMASIGSPFGSRGCYRLWITTRENREKDLIAADWLDLLADWRDFLIGPGQGQGVALSSLSSQARAVCQSRSAVAVEIPSASLASSSDRPPKNLSSAS